MLLFVLMVNQVLFKDFLEQQIIPLLILMEQLQDILKLKFLKIQYYWIKLVVSVFFKNNYFFNKIFR